MGAVPPQVVRIVSFNIAFGECIDRAIALLASDADLRRADVILLQEMDALGTQQIAGALGMAYVYYPTIYHVRAKRDVGNAVLSRWPILDDAKLILPHPSRYAKTHRAATAATLSIGSTRVRVYSTHLGTFADIGPGQRQAQLRSIIAHAHAYPLVVIGGDMNAADVGHLATVAGYTWPTELGPRTTTLGRFDHIFFKGFRSPDSGAAGTVLPPLRISDHRPVWAMVIMP